VGNPEVYCADLEHRPQAEKRDVHCGRERARDYQGNEGARFELKQKKFDDKDDSSDGCIKGGGHAGGGSAS
jgi:hypothetical protein